jgi:hypothetical protein
MVTAHFKMYLAIKGNLNLSNYFTFLLVSAAMLVAIVFASYYLDVEKERLVLVIAILGLTSLGSSFQIMRLLKRYNN